MLVAAGTYFEHDIEMTSDVKLLGQSGPDSTVVDAQGLGRVIFCNNVDEETEIEGFTLTGGSAQGTTPGNRGGGMYCYWSHPTVTNCHLRDNSASQQGGGMYCIEASPTLTGCTFAGNSGTHLYCINSSSPSLENTILAFASVGGSVFCADNSHHTLTCCDVYGNVGGDWRPCIGDQYGINGNISEDPLFCDRDRLDLHLATASPCLDADTCSTIGALGHGCSVPRLGIETILDTPDDYGGYVDVSWWRDGYDGATGDTVVDYYSIWRRVDVLRSASVADHQILLDGVGDAPPGTWEFIDSVAATGQAEYTVTCPTVQDSSEAGVGWSFFFVKAHCPCHVYLLL